MYRLDENYLDQKYFLRPIDDEQQWKESEKKLQLILRTASDRCYEQQLISKNQRDQFHISGRNTNTNMKIFFSSIFQLLHKKSIVH